MKAFPMKRTILAITAGAMCATSAWADETNSLPTLTLTNAQALALRLHPQIASANYLVLAAQEVVKEARSGYFPQVNLYGTAVGANQEGKIFCGRGKKSSSSRCPLPVCVQPSRLRGG